MRFDDKAAHEKTKKPGVETGRTCLVQSELLEHQDSNKECKQERLLELRLSRRKQLLRTVLAVSLVEAKETFCDPPIVHGREGHMHQMVVQENFCAPIHADGYWTWSEGR